MERALANRFALRSIRSILDAARHCEVVVDEKPVTVRIERTGERTEGEPPVGTPGLEGESWPETVAAVCTWEGGRVKLALNADGYQKGVAFSLRLHPRRGQLLWFSLTPVLMGSEGDDVLPVRGSVGLRKGRREGQKAIANKSAGEQLRRLVTASGMPLLKKSVELFRVDASDGAVLPTPAEAFERILRLALYKLDFFSRRPRSRAERGSPLIAVPALDELGESDDEDDSEESEPRAYWAGGFLWGEKGSQLDRFLDEGIWEVGWSRDSRDSAAHTTWQRFDRIGVGDWLAVKGLGGKHDLRIHRIGEVTGIEADRGRLQLRWLETPPYSGKAPVGTGAGNWHDTLLPVQRPADVELLFGIEPEEEGEHAGELGLSPNLILYGPPGTGKTYELREKYVPLFRGEAQGVHRGIDIDLVQRLTWFELVGSALHELGRPTSVKDLSRHRWLVAKFSLKPFKASLGARLWGTLQGHTVESSETVQYSKRTGELLIFDKNTSGDWFLPDGAPEHLQELADALGKPPDARDRFSFITFHQSYGYEDFIEGIRPRTIDDDADGGGQIAYELEDGLFMRAVRAALELSGYEHSVHEFCTELSAEERAERLANAPPYAVFVDEINRGNVARIFGELITLIEPTRRLGEPEELIVTLPGSRTSFGVPRNLHLIGTMNTADRSVEALDTALRRRFAFRECMPRPELLDVVVEGEIDPRRLLTRINERLLKLLDRDHLIGHAFFMPLLDDPSFERLQSVFRDSILPLLQEYFYGDWGRIGLVLGKDFVRRHDHGHVRFADFLHDDAEALGERSTYELADLDSLSSESFRRIYADVASDD